MKFFSKSPISKTESIIKKLFKDSKITENERSKFLIRIKDIKYTKNLKFGNTQKYLTMLKDLDNELSQKNKEVIELQKSEKNTEVQTHINESLSTKQIQDSKSSTFKESAPHDHTTESSYTVTQKLVDQLEQTLKTKTIQGFNRNEILKSIGDPRYLSSITEDSKYQEELEYLVGQTNYDNFEDIAFFLKDKNEEKKLSQVLAKHLKNASRLKMIRVVSKIYETNELDTFKRVANIYLNKGEYVSAREVYPTGKLGNIALINCAEKSKAKSDYLSALKCYAELEKVIPMQKMIHALIKHSSIFEAEKSIQKIPIALPEFKIVLRELIVNEKIDSRFLIQIKNLIKEKSNYEKCAELLARRLFKDGNYTQGLKVLQLQKVEPSEELLGFILSEFEIQISEKKIHNQESVNDLCTFLIKQGKEKIVCDKEQEIKEYYYNKGTKEEFIDFSLLLWDIKKKKKNLIENAA